MEDSHPTNGAAPVKKRPDAGGDASSKTTPSSNGNASSDALSSNGTSQVNGLNGAPLDKGALTNGALSHGESRATSINGVSSSNGLGMNGSGSESGRLVPAAKYDMSKVNGNGSSNGLSLTSAQGSTNVAGKRLLFPTPARQGGFEGARMAKVAAGPEIHDAAPYLDSFAKEKSSLNGGVACKPIASAHARDSLTGTSPTAWI